MSSGIRQHEGEHHLLASRFRIRAIRRMRGFADFTGSIRHGALARGSSTAAIVRPGGGNPLRILVPRTPNPLLVSEAGNTPFGGIGVCDSVRQPRGGIIGACNPMTRGKQGDAPNLTIAPRFQAARQCTWAG